MKKITVAVVLLVILSAALPAGAQSRVYTVSDTHSHNDYVNKIPFYLAYNAGFGSIEADIYLFHNRLLVGHDSADLVSNRSIEQYYIRPLDSAIGKNGGSVYADASKKLLLLVDIKNAPQASLDSLIALIRRYPAITNCRSLRITITGSRPDPETFAQYPAFIWFDGVLSASYSPQALTKIVLMSDNLRAFYNWRGNDSLPAAGLEILRIAVNKGHASGKPVRFWNAPDTPYAWEQLMSIGVDYINTDHIVQLADFIAEKAKNRVK